VISTVSHSPEAIAAAAWRTWIMNEQPPTAVPSTHFGVRPQTMRDRYWRLAGGRDAVDVREFVACK
jgi:hypothetical protein